MNGKDFSSVLGLDVGALAIKLAFVGPDGRLRTSYRIHRGRPEKTVLEMLGLLDGCRPTAVAITGGGGRRLAEKLGVFYVDPAVALISASRTHKGIRHIIDIGGGSLSIVDLDKESRFAGFRTNSLCAAGTGAFLDEQAIRMNLCDEDRTAERDIAEPPRIAARCAVFAKSDLIHRQQEGYTIPEMWSGLCFGMVTTALSTLFRGRRPDGPVLLAGGVAKTLEVVRWLRKGLCVELVIPPEPETFSAVGAMKAAGPVRDAVNWGAILNKGAEGPDLRRPALELSLSKYPSFDCGQSYVDDDTEVRIHDKLEGEVVVGVDVGSTSTKAAILDLKGRVIADMYRRTAGDPIGATQKILKSISRAAAGNNLSIKGVGTTGSGRKMIGAILGADCVINEITAHVWGAKATDEDVETIFEIGGQDAKFVALKDGRPHDSNMNYVCAAGTGSFVEEQAGKLGFPLTEIGDAVMGTRPPFSSDRCTVFMEQDVHYLIRQGYERREVMGSVLYSVVQNYLSRVVGRRPYSRKKICFMGATARNKGLVAAFEKLLDAPIVVSPYCHVMGAFGVAMIILEEVVRKGKGTQFRGISVADSKITLTREECRLCANTCRITRALVGGCEDGGTGPSWGYMCGRDPEDRRIKVNKHFDAFRKRQRIWNEAGRVASLPAGAPVVGLPRALLVHTYFPLWRSFFARLGATYLLSKPTHEGTLPLAIDNIGSDYCYPVKLAHGHVRELARDPKVSFIFLPYVIQAEPHDDKSERSVFCPYNIAFPSIAKVAGLSGPERKLIATAVINFQLATETIVGELARELGPLLKRSKRDIEAAWLAARGEQEKFATKVEMLGEGVLAEIEASGGRGVVILGRPYNVYDLGSNLSLPQKISDLGLTALTVDMLPISGVEIDRQFHNMYWRYGRKVLQAATFIVGHPRLYAVYLSNFGCGPDAFLQTYVEKIMQGKPMLMLELDEHSADAGYITRLEAFRDVILSKESQPRPERRVTAPRRVSEFFEVPASRGLRVTSHESRTTAVRTLWLPPMHPYGTSFLAAALRSVGFPARPLPPETLESFELAKRYCRGTECVPAPATIGAFLSILQKSDAPERESFFMPSAKGPCRFGQYHTLHRMILDAAGYKDTPIEAWSDESGTYGTDMKTSRRLYNAILASDLLYKARCRIRPYADDRGAFDDMMKGVFDRVVSVIEHRGDLVSELRRVAGELGRVKRVPGRRPLVGVVGEIYVRLNPFTNGNLVEVVEDAGGEAWVAPIIEWLQYLAFLDVMNARTLRKGIGTRLKLALKNAYMMRKEHLLARTMAGIIGDRQEPPIESTVNAGSQVFPRQFDGESILTVGRAIEFAREGADLIVNCAPFGCMPGTLTAGIFQRLEAEMGVPVVSLFFDGEADLSHLVRTYLENVRGSLQEGKTHVAAHEAGRS